MHLRGLGLVVLVSTALLVVVFIYILIGHGLFSSNQIPQFSIDEIRELLRGSQIANGHIENRTFAEAESELQDILSRLPDEPSAIRNLAISRLLAFEENQGELPEVEASLRDLQRVDLDAAGTHWLAGRAHRKAQEVSQDPTEKAQHLVLALEAFDRAVERDESTPPLWWDIYETTRYAHDPSLKRRAQQALAQAHNLAPHNFFVLTEWLLAQAEHQDPGVTVTLNQIRDTITPIAAGIEQRTNISVAGLIDEVVADAANKDWAKILPKCLRLTSIIRSEEISRGDHRRISLHPLEFIEHDFRGPIRQQLVALTPERPPPLEVRWTPIHRDSLLSKLDDVRDVVAVDFDFDQLVDLLVLRPDSLEVYLRRSDGWQRLPPVPLKNRPRGLLVADLDRDTFSPRDNREPDVDPNSSGNAGAGAEPCFEADVDVVAFGLDGVVVLENRLDPTSEIRSLNPIAQPGELPQLSQVATGTFVDFDHDGDLDLAFSTSTGIHLWSSRDNLTFEDATSWSILPPTDASIQWMVAVDWDRDVDTDIVLGGTGERVGYLENLRHGQLRWRRFANEFSALDSSADGAVLEIDRNASWDLVGTVPEGLAAALTRSTIPGVTQHVASHRVDARGGQSLVAFDYDNDGWQDVVLWGQTGVTLLQGVAGGHFSEPRPIIPQRPTQRCVPCDLDSDGDLDLITIANGRLNLFDNDGGNTNYWLKIRVRGEQEPRSGRVNHNGIGSLVEIKAGDAYQAQVVAAPQTHFGLGRLERADVARVLFTNGIPQSAIHPRADQSVCEKMMLKGSCPYLYTWNGERFDFYTDLLWAAPLGLQLADGVIARDRPWEFLKIAGDRLQPKEGGYVLQVTEELWEAAYFDQIELIAVDHPTHIEVFTNEKVGPPAIAEHQLHTVRQRHYPVAARDSRGRDVLDRIRSQDGIFLRAFEQTFRQGLAETHFVELDLGKLDDPQRVVLFLTGWIYPTDTSLNVALTNNPLLSPPRPPGVWVPDRNGKWREVIPFMGFPGGKTKTIAVNLSDAFLAKDYRLRIVTSAEIYWDEIFFAVDEDPLEVSSRSLRLISADLHYRGFSRPQPARVNSPQTYNYNDLDRLQRWPPMQGHFTGYGDVRELLVATDDFHVILASGDELTLRFEIPDEPLPPGWSRDFVLHNVGWDKDADLNTVYGQTVGPLPFVGMSSYPFRLGEAYPASSLHRDYRREHQTRIVSPAAFWKQILRYGAN